MSKRTKNSSIVPRYRPRRNPVELVELSEELFVAIFSWLSLVDLAALSRVSRLCYRIAHDRAVFRASLRYTRIIDGYRFIRRCKQKKRRSMLYAAIPSLRYPFEGFDGSVAWYNRCKRYGPTLAAAVMSDHKDPPVVCAFLMTMIAEKITDIGAIMAAMSLDCVLEVMFDLFERLSRGNYTFPELQTYRRYKLLVLIGVCFLAVRQFHARGLLPDAKRKQLRQNAIHSLGTTHQFFDDSGDEPDPNVLSEILCTLGPSTLEEYMKCPLDHPDTDDVRGSYYHHEAHSRRLDFLASFHRMLNEYTVNQTMFTSSGLAYWINRFHAKLVEWHQQWDEFVELIAAERLEGVPDEEEIETLELEQQHQALSVKAARTILNALIAYRDLPSNAIKIANADMGIASDRV